MKVLKNIFTVIKVVVGATILIVAAVLMADYFEITETVKPFIVMSGSMEPAVKLGSVAVVKPQSSYQSNDIITYAPDGNFQNPVTHRIVFRQFPKGVGNDPVYLTAGDANEDMDRWQVQNSQVIGKVIFSIPYLGYAANFTKQPYGFILLVIVPATIVIYEELKSFKRELGKIIRSLLKKISSGRSRKSDIKENVLNINLLQKKTTSFPKSAALFPIIGAILVFASLSTSFFFDIDSSIGNLLGAAETYGEEPEPTPTPTTKPTPTPTPTVNPGDVVINEINWGGSNGNGLDEWVELLNTISSPIDISNWVVERLGTGSGPNRDVIIPSSSTIPANGFFLISNNSRDSSSIDVESDHVITNVSLLDAGEQLVLKTAFGTLIDTANGTGAWFEGSNSTPKKSMERKDLPGDGTLGSNWQTAITHTNMDSSGPTDEFATPKAVNGL